MTKNSKGRKKLFWRIKNINFRNIVISKLLLLGVVFSDTRLYDDIDTADVKYLIETASKYCDVNHKFEAISLCVESHLQFPTDSSYIAIYSEPIRKEKGFYKVTSLKFQSLPSLQISVNILSSIYMSY